MAGWSTTAGTRVPPERRGIGYVPQDGALFPHLTVAANVGFGRSRLPASPGRRGHARPCWRWWGWPRWRDRYPHELSGGQQQRVALARALAIEPSLVLLDEPFSSLDASLRASVRAEVLQILRDGGVTAVLVTHDQDEALSVADQVAVIRDGVIGQSGAPTRSLRPPGRSGHGPLLGRRQPGGGHRRR